MSRNLRDTVRAILWASSLVLLVGAAEGRTEERPRGIAPQSAAHSVLRTREWKVAVAPGSLPRTSRDLASKKKDSHTRLLLAQGKYALIFVPQVEYCENLVIEAKLKGQGDDQWKDKQCMKYSIPALFWTYDYQPNEKYDFRVTLYDEDDIEKVTVLLETEVYPLPEKPPSLSEVKLWTNVGPGWIEIIFQVPKERSPNLLGYSLTYEIPLWKEEHHKDHPSQFEKKISDIEYVDYSQVLPRAMPVHPCPWWNIGEYFCILISDFVRPDYYLKQMKNTIRIKTFRILPIGEKHFSDEHVVGILQRMCDVEKEDSCPTFSEFLTPSSTVNKNKIGGGRIYIPAPGMTFDSNMTWEEKVKKSKTSAESVLRSMKFWLVLIGPTIIFFFLAFPFAYVLGKRSGASSARHRWLRLVSSRTRTTLSLCDHEAIVQLHKLPLVLGNAGRIYSCDSSAETALVPAVTCDDSCVE